MRQPIVMLCDMIAAPLLFARQTQRCELWDRRTAHHTSRCHAPLTHISLPSLETLEHGERHFISKLASSMFHSKPHKCLLWLHFPTTH